VGKCTTGIVGKSWHLRYTLEISYTAETVKLCLVHSALHGVSASVLLQQQN
jgi:hypothetical protein